MTDDEIKETRANSFYSAAVGAWFNVRLEHDRGILTLSTLAIGLLAALVGKVSSSLPGLLLCGLASLAFVFAVIFVLRTYRQSADYLEEVVSTKEFSPANEKNKKLEKSEKTASAAFGAGVILTVVMAVWTGSLQHREGNSQMGKDSKGSQGMARDGFSGAANLQKGFSGAGALAPKPSQAPNPPAANPATPAPSPATAAVPPAGGNGGSK